VLSSDPELFGVPIDDDCSQQIQTSDAVMLTCRGAITYLALPPYHVVERAHTMGDTIPN
jgi:hypothetical protein